MKLMPWRKAVKRVVAIGTIGGLLIGLVPPAAHAAEEDDEARGRHGVRTPIEHVVVIFQENVSFDHYFATYPHAENLPGESVFNARRHTPKVDNLVTAGLLAPHNPNTVQPFRLTRAQADTCDQNHEYKAEQEAFNNGKMDDFVNTVGIGAPGCLGYGRGKGLVMGYYDGSTVTALWNYAQHFAMTDRSFNTTFGPSTSGALNLISGLTHGAEPADLSTPFGPDTVAGSVVGDPQPAFDDCSTRETVAMKGRNVGDLLNDRGVTWGFFQGGFKPTASFQPHANGMPATKAVCGAVHIGANGKPKGDYIPHHQPFQYYASTANPHHLPPSSVTMIGHTDQANHQYDLVDFWAAVDAGHMPAVTFLKASGFQDGHADYSSPLFEQQFLVETLNRLQARPEWKKIAVIIAYDDSDGWYDHVRSPLVNPSSTPKDAAFCSGESPRLGPYQGRCGYGPRLPLLVISPFAKDNFVAHNVTDQSSILRFIENNWGLDRIGDHSFDAIAGSLMPMFDFDERRDLRLILDPTSGEVVSLTNNRDDD